MFADVDAFRAAKLLVDRHGKDAPDEALRRADQLALEGNTEGCAVFRHIATACRELLRVDRDGERLN